MLLCLHTHWSFLLFLQSSSQPIFCSVYFRFLFFSSQCSIWLFSTVSIFFPIIFVLHFKYPSAYLYSILNDLPNMKLLFCKSQLLINQDSLALQLCLGYNGVTDPFQNNDWWKFEKVVRVSDTYVMVTKLMHQYNMWKETSGSCAWKDLKSNLLHFQKLILSLGITPNDHHSMVIMVAWCVRQYFPQIIIIKW